MELISSPSSQAWTSVFVSFLMATKINVRKEGFVLAPVLRRDTVYLGEKSMAKVLVHRGGEVMVPRAGANRQSISNQEAERRQEVRLDYKTLGLPPGTHCFNQGSISKMFQDL